MARSAACSIGVVAGTALIAATLIAAMLSPRLSARAADLEPVAADESAVAASAKASPREVAREVDRLIDASLKEAGASVAPRTSDEDFLRRVSLDLAATLPTPRETTLFALDDDPEKRAKAVDRLLAGNEFSAAQGRYWRDVIMLRATNPQARIAQQPLERWLTEQFRRNAAWDEIVTGLVTATGEVNENGATGLIFAHNAQPQEVAGEVARIFIGIQIQCANCHDHPIDSWKREDFHNLAAYFPRIRVQQSLDPSRRSFEVIATDVPPDPVKQAEALESIAGQLKGLDRDGDGKVTAEEANGRLLQTFNRMLRTNDRNRNGALDADELGNLRLVNQFGPRGRGRGGAEYTMPNLDDPRARGTPMQPVFFVDQTRTGNRLSDKDRRDELAKNLTKPENPWFARAYVNRVWTEMLGRGFYDLVDDMGPERIADSPEVLDLLADGFVKSDYDVRWVHRTIAATETYQRRIESPGTIGGTPAFASATPTRLRADAIYSALERALDFGRPQQRPLGRGRGNPAMMARRGGFASPRAQFEQLFGFDPSTPQDEVLGTVPQALFLMNSPAVNNQIRATGNTPLATILRDNRDDEAALRAVYLRVLARAPSETETKACLDYVAEVGSRGEAFEDVMWSLVNSSEFVSRR
ncbi:MAG: DUF1549 domain-containing protein [Planctomycetaceae bacterium]